MQADLSLRWAHISDGTFFHVAAQILFDFVNVPAEENAHGETVRMGSSICIACLVCATRAIPVSVNREIKP